jgi:hypothetical protein
MKCVLTLPEDVAGTFRSYLPITAAITLFLNACDQTPLVLQTMQDPTSLILR